ncbi:hypothetical protein [Micromonospora okii]|uniref:hypothetical protein n=1 Tax=Micromonospora okii TaxID=1182970 RepID=UPI001E650FF2|nr:hypothetical protein [Micromonospora okii]
MENEKTPAVGIDPVAETAPPTQAPPAPPLADTQQAAKKAARRSRRKVAKALLYAALAVTALLVLAEPWLLLPIALAVVALSLQN